ncbi:hypothetical protein RhiXN_10413 [Rhizoctonia solani]|uniref:Uncharacterized protein n=1 Tax=Rhizoctonia solani TaxID=456999 RepID=A0A8H8SZY0_9AGAM|nr:uncharacterized protein RhiXN_10413 [Rhizoctonia solani]QRW24089.1 hypothetical protein RhiXN_10413 [Rhizoctonia solani]
MDPQPGRPNSQVQLVHPGHLLRPYLAGVTQATTKLEGVLQSLQSIGNTQFATIYYAATSVLDNLPALYRIYQTKEIDTKGTPLPSIVAEALDETTVTALNSLSDVYFFWLGALAALDHHFKSQNCLLLPQDWGRLHCIALKRFNKAINDAPTDGYVTAFFLDPRYHDVAIYASSNACSRQATVLPPVDCPQTSNPQQLNKYILNCVQKQLFAMLKAELEAAKDIPHHPLHAYSQDALVAKEQLREQLDCYYWADQQFLSQYLMPNQSALQYWRSQKQFEHMFILAHLAEKLFSILPNSMCNKCAGMIKQIQFMQWESLVNGLFSKRQEKKLPVLFRFSDLPSNFQPNCQADKDASKIAPALEDKCGDEWLDCSRAAAPIADTSNNKEDTRFEDIINLTLQELLALFSSYNSSMHAADSESHLPHGTKGLEGVSKESKGPQRAIWRARDINWD